VEYTARVRRARIPCVGSSPTAVHQLSRRNVNIHMLVGVLVQKLVEILSLFAKIDDAFTLCT